MLTTIRLDLRPIVEDFNQFLDTVTSKILFKAADDGGQVILNTYRADLLNRTKTSGQYRSATEGIKNFIAAYESVAKRTLLFKDRQGAYSVVGIATAQGNWRMASPQAMWLEDGADGHSQSEQRGERYHESDGQGTGVEQAQHVLANIVEQTADVVLATMQNTIAEQLEQLVS